VRFSRFRNASGVRQPSLPEFFISSVRQDGSSSDFRIHSYTQVKRFSFDWGLSQFKSIPEGVAIRIRNSIGHQAMQTSNANRQPQNGFDPEPLERKHLPEIAYQRSLAGDQQKIRFGQGLNPSLRSGGRP
jgi:hypothetical protein